MPLPPIRDVDGVWRLLEQIHLPENMPPTAQEDEEINPLITAAIDDLAACGATYQSPEVKSRFCPICGDSHEVLRLGPMTYLVCPRVPSGAYWR